jgi:hypothetical protein
MPRILALLVVLALVMPAAARAEVGALIGAWQQISSNAGKCPTCQIAIDGIGSLSVTANNGWSATVIEGERGGNPAATGAGRWRVQGGDLDGKTFDVDFELHGDRLTMTMRIDAGRGSRRVVRAVYGRPWLGS